MTKRPHTHGDPALATRAPGYVPQGTGEWSRKAMRRCADVKPFRDHAPAENLYRFILHERANVRRLQRRLTEAEAAGDAAKIAITMERLDKTSQLLARLIAEKPGVGGRPASRARGGDEAPS